MAPRMRALLLALALSIAHAHAAALHRVGDAPPSRVAMLRQAHFSPAPVLQLTRDSADLLALFSRQAVASPAQSIQTPPPYDVSTSPKPPASPASPSVLGLPPPAENNSTAPAIIPVVPPVAATTEPPMKPRKSEKKETPPMKSGSKETTPIVTAEKTKAPTKHANPSGHAADKNNERFRDPIAKVEGDKRTPTPSVSPAFKPSAAQNSNSNASTSKLGNESSSGSFPMAAIIGIAVGASVVAIVVVALLIVVVRKRSVTRTNSYFHFPDSDEAGRGGLPATASVDNLALGAGGVAAASIARKKKAESGTMSARSGGSGSSGGSGGGRRAIVVPAAPPTPPAPPPIQGADQDFADRVPAARMALPYGKRSSLASSASSDTIVAPEFGAEEQALGGKGNMWKTSYYS